MKIEFDIPDEILTNAALAAVRASFRAPDRWSDGSDLGHRVIWGQVNAWAKEQDFTPMIEAAARQLIPEVVHEVTKLALQAEVKKVLKEMRERGDLAMFVSAPHAATGEGK